MNDTLKKLEVQAVLDGDRFIVLNCLAPYHVRCLACGKTGLYLMNLQRCSAKFYCVRVYGCEIVDNKTIDYYEGRKYVSNNEPNIGATYQHYKGGKYIVTGLARREDTGKIAVLYVNVNDPPDTVPWDRPLDEFEEKFTFVKPAELKT